jgi:hypothetical protein
VATGDILSFDFTSAPPGTLIAPLSGTQAGPFGLYTAGMLTVMGGNLWFDPPMDIVGSENLDGYYGIAFANADPSAQSPQSAFVMTDDPYLQGGLDDGRATEDSYGSDFLIATDPSPAPEIDPAAGVAALTLLAGLLACLRESGRE